MVDSEGASPAHRLQEEQIMTTGLEGIKVIEVGGAFAMPLAGMLMGSWGADVIHVEPPNGEICNVIS